MRRAFFSSAMVLAGFMGCAQIAEIDSLEIDPCFDGGCGDAVTDTRSDRDETSGETLGDGSNGDVTSDVENTESSVVDASQDQNTDAPLDATPDANPNVCPGSKPGPIMIRIPGSTACIDQTEVTWTQYQAFIAGKGVNNFTGQPSTCAWNADYGPKTLGNGSQPVRGVDWCDATAYCAWAGKQLCKQTTWQAACTNGGATGFAYGSTYVEGRCNDFKANVNNIVAVSNYLQCKTPTGVHDLNGNVFEWHDQCGTGTVGQPQTDPCNLSGGSYGSGADVNYPAQGYTCLLAFSGGRNYFAPDLGFRCCTP